VDGGFERGGDAFAELFDVVRGLDGDAAALEVFHGVGAEFGVEHAEDFGGDVVDCYLRV
jgi:hypothetical protein